MISQLIISNFAIIKDAELVLSDGLNVLTGETGAGKSLIIDSLNLVTGERGNRDLIRAGEKSARVEAVFSLPDGLLPEELGEEILLSRELFADGRNVCRINGRAATLAQLREVGSYIINIHGQQDNQNLLKQSSHMDFVDKYAGEELLGKLETYREIYSEQKRVKKEIETLEKDDGEKLKRLDTLRYWAEEIEMAQLVPGEDEELASRRDVLENAEKLEIAVNGAYDKLYGEDNSARDLLSVAAQLLQTAAGFDHTLEEAVEAVYDALYKAEDVAHGLASYRLNISGDAAELDEALDRIDLINKLKTKFGGSIDDINNYGKEREEEILAIETSDERLSELKGQFTRLSKDLEDAAADLHNVRAGVCAEIEKRVMDELSGLDMKNVVFKIDIAKCDYTQNGADHVEFMISTSPAEPVKPMVKIASGGEMSRICLALKTVLANADTVPTLIFDEIDTGVSGRAAIRIGERLRFLGRGKQVICITHLPQIAAMAQHHYLVEKELSEGAVTASVLELDGAGRINEVARIIGGDRVSDKTLQTAEEMINDFVE